MTIYVTAIAKEPVIAISRKNPSEEGILRSSVDFSLFPTAFPRRPEITDRQVVGCPIVKESSPVTFFTNGLIRFGETTI